MGTLNLTSVIGNSLCITIFLANHPHVHQQRSPSTNAVSVCNPLSQRDSLSQTRSALSHDHPDQEREREPKKSSVYNPHTRLTVAGATDPDLVRPEVGGRDAAETLRRTHNRGCCDGDHGFSPFRFNLAIRTSLSLARERYSRSLFVFCGIACAFVFDFVYPLSFEREGRQRQNEAHRHTRNAQRMQIFRVRTGPVSLSMDQHKGTGPAELQVASERSRALSRSLVCCASRAQFSLAGTFGRSSSPSFGKVEEGRTTELSFLVSFRHSDSRTDRVNTRFVLYRCSKRFLYYRCIVLLLF